MLKLIDILKEVGDASAKPYRFELYIDDEDYRTYGFNTDSGIPYSVQIDQLDKDEEGGVTIDIRFFIPSENDPDIEDYNAVTNEDEVYRIMATIKNIVQQEIDNNPNINRIAFTPSRRSKDTATNARLNLYSKYIKDKKAFPNAQFEKGESGKVIVKIK